MVPCSFRQCPFVYMQVLVLRLQTTGSIEERIYAVASEKRMVADTSITGDFDLTMCTKNTRTCLSDRFIECHRHDF